MHLKYIGLLLLIGFLGSCTGSPAWYSGQMKHTAKEAKVNNEAILSVKLGMSKEEVLEIMGSPTKTEAYSLEGGKTIEFLFYRTQGWSGVDAGDRDYQFTPFAFSGDKLVGWGRNYYDRVVKQSLDININK